MSHLKSGTLDFIAATSLFNGSSPDEVRAMIGCLGAREKSFPAGAYIHRMGDVITTVGLVLSGSVRVESLDVWGNASVIASCRPGDMFGESYAAVPDEPLLVNVIATEECSVLFLDLKRVLITCPHACPHHSRTATNMTTAIARENLRLSRRILHVAPKTIRGKVLAYLSDEAERAGSKAFTIPYDRQQLADYLGVNRSALSAELSKMQEEGLISTRRSYFELH